MQDRRKDMKKIMAEKYISSTVWKTVVLNTIDSVKMRVIAYANNNYGHASAAYQENLL